MTDRYALIGHPVASSRSPYIHSRFAEQTGQRLVYEAIDVEPGRFGASVEAFRAAGGLGLNVTLPFKEEAFALAAWTSERAARAGAANTLWFEGQGVRADNTDGVGLLRDLEANVGISPAGRRVLLLGAGGAARGVVGPLLERGPAALVIANRGLERARVLAADFADAGPVAAAAFDELAGEAFDLVLNATSAGHRGVALPLPETVVGPGACCYDLSYGAAAGAFLAWARGAGASRVIDGLGMLVEQAAESFLRWRGVRPATAPVVEALRRSTPGN